MPKRASRNQAMRTSYCSLVSASWAVARAAEDAAMAATKKALWAAFEHGLTDACKAGAAHLVSMWGHPDQDEGPKAFTEKREANWL